MKKVNITTAVLLIYLIVMSIIGWPGKQADPDYVQYFGVIAATVLVIGLLPVSYTHLTLPTTPYV